MHLSEIILEHSSQSINSMGRLIAPTQDGIKKFWQWFGNSKAVNKKGQPLILFHGTTADFKAFDPNKANTNSKSGVPQGTFVFSNSVDTAQTYAGQIDKGYFDSYSKKKYQEISDLLDKELMKIEQYRSNDLRKYIFFSKRLKEIIKKAQIKKKWKPGANVIPVYLKITNPLVVSANGKYWNKIEYGNKIVSTNDLMKIAKSKGYDGVIITNVHDRHAYYEDRVANTYAVFSQSQIKSAIGNNGNFDLDNPNIDESFDVNID